MFFAIDMDWKRAASFITLEETPLGGGAAATGSLSPSRRANPEEVKAAWPYGYYGRWNDRVQPSTGTVLIVKPARALLPDHVYHLMFAEGLPAAAGHLGAAQPAHRRL